MKLKILKFILGPMAQAIGIEFNAKKKVTQVVQLAGKTND
jgi:hypothetical protein